MATIAQSISMNAHGGQARVGEGNKTQAIYTLISEQKYQEGATTNTATHSHPKRCCCDAALDSGDANVMRLPMLMLMRAEPFGSNHQCGRCCDLCSPHSIRCDPSVSLSLPLVQPSKC